MAGNCNREQVLLYGVTDRHWLGEQTLYQQVEAALKGGVTIIQLREKTLTTEEFVGEAREIKTLCDIFHVPLIINDRVDVALAVDADGVHVGQSDMEVCQAREKLGPEKIIGVSARTVEQAILAQEQGADYLGVGAVFPTSTKADAREIDNRVLEDICHSVDIPVVAIGGISMENVESLRGSGIDGVAVVSAVFGQKDITQASKALRERVAQVVSVQ